MGICVVAIVGGLGTAIFASDTHRKYATSETLLRTAAENVKNAQVHYVDCATTATYSSVLPSVPGGYQDTITGVQYINALSGDTVTATFSNSCPAPDRGVQLITITAQSNDGRAKETLQILKRRDP